MRTSRTRFGSVWLGVALLAFAFQARASELDASQRMKILMRVLTYDRQLESRQDSGTVRVAVLFSPGDDASVKEKDEVLAALGALKSLKIKGLALDFSAIPYHGAGALEGAVKARRTASLYVCGGLDPAVGEIRGLAARLKIATMSGSEPFTRNGLAFAAFEKDGKGQIIVNLKSSKEQGLDLDAALLGLAIVLR
jgi:hypothetical protein